MKILQIAPLWESVPPPAYGGTEAVVHVLVEELVRRGHEVTLWASGDSNTSAKLRSCLPYSLRTADKIKAKHLYAWEHACRALEFAAQYNVIHNHAGEDVMALARLLPGAPILSTLHCNVSNDARAVWEGYTSFYNTISASQTRLMPQFQAPRFGGVAYNGIDVASFPFDEDKDDYLLFLGRISEEKGPHTAIDVAKRLNRRLLIAGKVDAADYEYFCSVIAPQIDGEQIVFMGEADGRLKRELYRKAEVLLMPIVWNEPFGLVMAEAQACGTPVIAFNRGAASEIVLDGETGFIVERADEMVDAVARVSEINPRRCRSWIEHKFSGEAMATRYEELYADVIRESRPAPRALPTPIPHSDGVPVTFAASRSR